jgi:hypothetical protein
LFNSFTGDIADHSDRFNGISRVLVCIIDTLRLGQAAAFAHHCHSHTAILKAESLKFPALFIETGFFIEFAKAVAAKGVYRELKSPLALRPNQITLGSAQLGRSARALTSATMPGHHVNRSSCVAPSCPADNAVGWSIWESDPRQRLLLGDAYFWQASSTAVSHQRLARVSR